jgi:hypothetical protein
MVKCTTIIIVNESTNIMLLLGVVQLSLCGETVYTQYESTSELSLIELRLW